MATPTSGSWKRLTRVARFGWQDEPLNAHVMTDGDWGGNRKGRKSTSGGVWVPGGNCIKTWSATQGAVAL
eukprot:3702709-Karenia_brevis.AAC.1